MTLLDSVKFDDKGLVIAIAQNFANNEILMVAYMNRDTLEETLRSGKMVYWSRSRGQRWMKGETSGHWQSVKEVYIDCDGDALLFKVHQTGAACHENYPECFFRKRVEDDWVVVKEKIVD